MAKQVKRLNARRVETISAPGYYPDGDGLYLQVTSAGAKSWVYCFSLRGRSREMGLGSAALLSLADARDRTVDARKLRDSGIDPIEQREVDKAAAAAAAALAVAR